MSERNKKTIFHFSIIFTIILLGFGLVVFKIVKIQTVEREDLLERGAAQVNRNEIISPNRGNIYDCKGRLLAGSSPTYMLYMDMRTQALHLNNDTAFYSVVDTLSECLSDFFKDKTAEDYRTYLMSNFKNKNLRTRITPHRITYTELMQVKKMPLFNRGRYKSGLIEEPRYERIKPFDLLASRSIGTIYGQTGRGSSGLEKRYDNILYGKEGHKKIQLIDGDVVVLENTEATDGYDIITTIDTHLQDIVEQQLMLQVSSLEADWGCCILMETKTGKVKAIANLGRQENGNYTEDKNYAVTRIEPGSTFKPIALMAALDDNKINLTDTIDPEGGRWIYSDAKRPIIDAHKYNHKLTVKQALAASSNVCLSKIVTSSYDKSADRFVNKLKQMKVCDSLDFEIPGTNSPRIDVPTDGETLARMAFGYYVELPPINTLTLYNAIANDGKMMKPYLVEKIQDNGITVKQFAPTTLSNAICKKSTIRDIQECLEAVVWDNDYGTASVSPWKKKKAQSNIVHIAGKTGTAQIYENGYYTSQYHRIAFCGYFPMEAPQYSCICVIHKPRKPNDAGMDCGGVVRRVAEKTMALIGNNIQHSVSKDSIITMPLKPSFAELKEANNFTTVPNVIGMGAKDAVFAIEQTGMLTTISGKGRVVRQSVPHGTKAVRGATVHLELK